VRLRRRTWLITPYGVEVRRVSVVGNSGSGKTTFARELANKLGVPYLELDAVFHQPGWSQLAMEEFRDRVARVIAEPGWVIDGNYSAVRDLVWQRADTVVWLDIPRAVVMRRLVRRTVTRLLTRRELWNGNRERWSNLFRRDPDKSVLAWAWAMHRTYRDLYSAAANDPANRHLTFITARGSDDCETLLRATD